MFGRKPKTNQAAVAGDIKVETIPSDFYGGVNPVVRFRQIEKEIAIKKSFGALTPSEQELINKETAVGGSARFHPANLLTSKKFLMIAAGIIFFATTAGAGWYYWQQAKKSAVVNQPPALAVAPDTSPEATTTVSDVVGEMESPTSTGAAAIPENNAPVVPNGPSLVFPSRLLAESADMDSDDASDMAEETFQTDPGVLDSDGDSYNDGHEIYYLYNPIGKEPLKLIESSLVKEFVNPVYGYSVYYPATWAFGNTDQSYSDVLFSTLTGEYVEIRAIDKDVNESFGDWFARLASGEQFGELQEFSSKFGEAGYRRDDFLVYYYPYPNKVYVILYHATNSNIVNYRIVGKLIARSFRLSATPPIISAPPAETNFSNLLDGSVSAGTLDEIIGAGAASTSTTGTLR